MRAAEPLLQDGALSFRFDLLVAVGTIEQDQFQRDDRVALTVPCFVDGAEVSAVDLADDDVLAERPIERRRHSDVREPARGPAVSIRLTPPFTSERAARVHRAGTCASPRMARSN